LVKTPFLLTDIDPSLEELVHHTAHKTLAIWARDCAERVLSYFETSYPDDPRPR
jgi:hypothetical protein